MRRIRRATQRPRAERLRALSYRPERSPHGFGVAQDLAAHQSSLPRRALSRLREIPVRWVIWQQERDFRRAWRARRAHIQSLNRRHQEANKP